MCIHKTKVVLPLQECSRQDFLALVFASVVKKKVRWFWLCIFAHSIANMRLQTPCVDTWDEGAIVAVAPLPV